MSDSRLRGRANGATDLKFSAETIGPARGDLVLRPVIISRPRLDPSSRFETGDRPVERPWTWPRTRLALDRLRDRRVVLRFVGQRHQYTECELGHVDQMLHRWLLFHASPRVRGPASGSRSETTRSYPRRPDRRRRRCRRPAATSRRLPVYLVDEVTDPLDPTRGRASRLVPVEAEWLSFARIAAIVCHESFAGEEIDATVGIEIDERRRVTLRSGGIDRSPGPLSVGALLEPEDTIVVTGGRDDIVPPRRR